jgi:enhancer of yellow 2 transcription factor
MPNVHIQSTPSAAHAYRQPSLSQCGYVFTAPIGLNGPLLSKSTLIIFVLLAEILLAEGNANMTVDELVKALRPRGRASVPDNVKAELLSKLRAHIVS